MMMAIDMGDGEGFAKQFHPEYGTVKVLKVGVEKKGAAELSAFCEGLHAKFAGCTHWEGNVCLTKIQDGFDGGEYQSELMGLVAPGRKVHECAIWLNQSYWKCMDGGWKLTTKQPGNEKFNNNFPK